MAMHITTVEVSMMNDHTRTTELLTPAEAARLLRVSKATLATWRTQARGPKYRKLGERMVRYTAEDVLAWAKLHEPGAA